MRNASGDGIEPGPDCQDDDYRSVAAGFVSLIEHVQASLRLIEQTMVRETSIDGPEATANVVVLDDVSPRYAKAAAALKACDVNLGIALQFLLDSRAPGQTTGANAEVPSVLSIS